MASIADSLTQKIGPLPAWGYGALIAGGVWAISLWQKRNVKPKTDALSELGFGAGTDAGWIEDTGIDSEDLNPSGVGSGSDNIGDSVTSPPQTNAEWLARCLLLLSDSYGYSREEVIAGLHKYLSGQSLTPSEWGMVLLAKAKWGNPPEGIGTPGTPSTPAPTTTPTTPTTPAPSQQSPSHLTVPALTNLYNWSQEIEAQYGLNYSVFGVIRSQVEPKWGPPDQWGADPQYGNVPYYLTTKYLAIR